jgi:hypothetical protein
VTKLRDALSLIRNGTRVGARCAVVGVERLWSDESSRGRCTPTTSRSSAERSPSPCGAPGPGLWAAVSRALAIGCSAVPTPPAERVARRAMSAGVASLAPINRFRVSMERRERRVRSADGSPASAARSTGACPGQRLPVPRTTPCTATPATEPAGSPGPSRPRAASRFTWQPARPLAADFAADQARPALHLIAAVRRRGAHGRGPLRRAVTLIPGRRRPTGRRSGRHRRPRARVTARATPARLARSSCRAHDPCQAPWRVTASRE